jgi:hypothetical protein
MDIKHKLTVEFLTNWLGYEPTALVIEKYYQKWWKNIRENGERSLRLTYDGFTFLKNNNLLKFYQIDVLDVVYTSKVMLQLDKYLVCPWYLSSNSTIWVSREKTAVELILFGGDLVKYGNSKYQSELMSKENSLTL